MRPRILVPALLVLTGCSSATPSSRPSALPSVPSVLVTPSTAVPVPLAPPGATRSGSSRPSPTATRTSRPVQTPADPLSPVPGRESAAPLGQPACAATALTVVDADAIIRPDSYQEIFVIRTTGPACQLKGWPTIRLLATDGSVLPATVGHGGFGLAAESPTAVTLDPGTTVSFAVASARSGSCRTAAQLVTTLPGTSSSHTVATSFPVCGAAVGVSPIHRSADTESSGG